MAKTSEIQKTKEIISAVEQIRKKCFVENGKVLLREITPAQMKKKVQKEVLRLNDDTMSSLGLEDTTSRFYVTIEKSKDALTLNLYEVSLREIFTNSSKKKHEEVIDALMSIKKSLDPKEKGMSYHIDSTKTGYQILLLQWTISFISKAQKLLKQYFQDTPLKCLKRHKLWKIGTKT